MSFDVTRLCQKRGCIREATQAIRLCVPGLGDPDDAPPKGSVLVGVRVCDEHLDGESAENWVTGETGDTIRPLLTVTMAPNTPDFDRAYLLGVSIHAAEYQDLFLHAPRPS